MKTCETITGILAFLLGASMALADEGHSLTFGSPGKESEAKRTVEFLATDNMRFSPGKLEVRLGETVKFVVRNGGKLKHEFTVGDRASQRAHALMMKKMPGMKHEDEPGTVTLEPGETKTVVWKFDKKPATPLEFACHEPGHYESGMKIAVVWSR